MDFGLQLTVWSLAIQQKYIILSPKSNMWNFTKDIVKPMLRAFNEQEFGGLYAVVHRIEMHDFIAIYSQNYWEEQVKVTLHFDVHYHALLLTQPNYSYLRFLFYNILWTVQMSY